MEIKVPPLCSASSDATLGLGFCISVHGQCRPERSLLLFFNLKKSLAFDQDWFAVSCISTENDLPCKINVELQVENAVVSKRGRPDKDAFTLALSFSGFPRLLDRELTPTSLIPQ